jgi:hypothetical protein
LGESTPTFEKCAYVIGIVAFWIRLYISLSNIGNEEAA